MMKSEQLTISLWRPLSRPPRRLWVACSVCHYSAINEDKALRGWQESISTLRRYRCAECAEQSARGRMRHPEGVESGSLRESVSTFAASVPIDSDTVEGRYLRSIGEDVPA